MKLTQETFHEILMVICNGVEDEAQYHRMVSILFQNMPERQRQFYWESFGAIQAASALLKGLGTHGESLEAALQEVSEQILKHAQAEDEDLPDNVKPIRH